MILNVIQAQVEDVQAHLLKLMTPEPQRTKLPSPLTSKKSLKNCLPTPNDPQNTSLSMKSRCYLTLGVLLRTTGQRSSPTCSRPSESQMKNRGRSLLLLPTRLPEELLFPQSTSSLKRLTLIYPQNSLDQECPNKFRMISQAILKRPNLLS